MQVYAQQIESLQAREASALSSVRVSGAGSSVPTIQWGLMGLRPGPPVLPASSATPACLPSPPLPSPQALEGKLKATNGGADAPPALAAPGFKWTLVKEGQEAAGAASPAAPPSRQSSTVGGTGPGLEGAPAPAAAAEDDSIKVGGSLLWGGTAARGASWGGGGRPRDQQVAALQQEVRELEATRDRLSEELVRAATEAAAGAAAQAAAAQARARIAELEEQLAAAVELLGEKEVRGWGRGGGALGG